jgi:hypothetical protein
MLNKEILDVIGLQGCNFYIYYTIIIEKVHDN